MKKSKIKNTSVSKRLIDSMNLLFKVPIVNFVFQNFRFFYMREKKPFCVYNFVKCLFWFWLASVNIIRRRSLISYKHEQSSFDMNNRVLKQWNRLACKTLELRLVSCYTLTPGRMLMKGPVSLKLLGQKSELTWTLKILSHARFARIN